MIDFLGRSLAVFRSCFRREAAFRWFVILAVTFILRDDHLGVTSVIRTLQLDPACYYAVLHFFRSAAYSTQGLRECWYRLVLDSGLAFQVGGRKVLIGDGMKLPKEGRRMPGVKKLRQESEDSSKGEYIFGHLFGVVGILMGGPSHSLCLPLRMNIQDGLQTAAGWEGASISASSHVIQMIENGYEAALAMGRSIFVVDRYFLTVPALKKLSQLNDSGGSGKLMELVSKARSNCVAYEEPPQRAPGTRGRPRLKGEAVKLAKLFDHTDRFTEASVSLYGKKRAVSYYSRDLLWGQKLYQKLRFVLVSYGDTRSILVSTDTDLEPETIIELYSHRFRIEGCFREFKQQFGGACYHFWTKSLGKLNHYRKKGEPDELSTISEPHVREQVLKAVDATERFVQVACIAMGLVQMMLLREKDTHTVQAARYIRTKTQGKISEATMMYYLRRTLLLGLVSRPGNCITQIIMEAKSGSTGQDEVA